jgi:hypothetical protein
MESVRDVTFRRVVMGSRWYPFAITGRNSGELGDAGAYRRNITLEDCSAVRGSSSHQGIAATRGGQGLVVRRHTDTRNMQYYGVSAPRWTDVTVEDSTFGIARQTPTTYGVNLSDSSGELVIRNCDFTGEGGNDHGADELYLGSAPVTHCGNRWGSGGQSGIQADGECQ